MKNKSIAYTKAYAFSIRIVHLYKYLCAQKREFVISEQISRSGISVVATLAEQLENIH